VGRWEGTRAFEVASDSGVLVSYVRLSRGERRVLSLLVRCYGDKEIALILGKSPSTVHTLLGVLRLALNCTNRAQLVRWAVTYPDSLSGVPCPKLIHPAGCLCAAPYCRAGSLDQDLLMRLSA
jgi:DNA-binding CsgD family transcriptional regulator